MNIVDTREASRFLNILNPSKQKLIFQTFDDSTKKDQSLVKVRVGNLDGNADTLIDLNGKGAGVFVTVNESRTHRRLKADIIRCRAIWQEDDIGTDKIPDLEPSLVVETSKGKYHRYWLIKDGTEDLKTWEKIMLVMTDQWDNDPNVKDLSRVMRIPGFYHNKGEPFLTKIVSNTEDVKYYEWDELVAYFIPDSKRREKSEYVKEDTETFDFMGAIKAILSGENFHGSLVSLSMRYANMGHKREEIIAIITGMIYGSGQADSERGRTTIADLPKAVDGAFKKLAKEQYVHPGLNNDIENTKKDEYLSLEYPGGVIGLIAKNVLEFMRYPSREIATETALHVVNVFSASSYNYDGIPNHRKTVLLAGQGRGKNVINTYMERVCAGMCEGNMANPIYLEFMGNGDYTSPKQMHLELQEFGSRSMISSEAGHMQATKAGDRVGIKGYENQLLMTAPESLVSPPRRQNSVKGELSMLPIQSVCISIIHESVASNYAKLFADREAYNDGSLSRTNFLFIDPIIDPDKKNRKSGMARVSIDALNILKVIADKYLHEGDPIHKHTGAVEQTYVEYDNDADMLLDDLEDEYAIQKNKANRDGDEVLISLYARKIVQIKQTCKILAVADNPMTPKVTLEQARWAILRSDKLAANMTYHATAGGLSGGMAQMVVNAMDWCKRYLKGKTTGKCKSTRIERRNHTIHAKVFRRHYFDAQKRIIAMLKQESAYKYMDNTKLYLALITELEQTSRIEVLSTKDAFGNTYSSGRTQRDFKLLGEI